LNRPSIAAESTVAEANVTVLELIKRSSEYLAKKGVDSPRLQVELLLAHVLKTPRLNLYLDFERQLSEQQLETLRNLVKRRGEREPLQYIVGSVSFCGLDLAVTPAVLIPRPETELLVEEAWKFLASGAHEEVKVLDFATGSGCIAIAIATKFPAAEVHAIDVSGSALEIARANADRHNARIFFHKAASIAQVISPSKIDLIVSNPPYIATAQIATLEPEVRNHEPAAALDGGADGLEFYRMLAGQAAPRVAPRGKLMLELGYGHSEGVCAILAGEGWTIETILPDYSSVPRILIAHR
jgi:release factor glutamine methyltransferase